MLTCRETTQLLSEGRGRRLEPVERFKLRLHLRACDAGNAFRHQIEFIRSAFRQYMGRENF